jgi:hypothetical protein
MPDRTAGVDHDDIGIWVCTRQRSHVRDLRVKNTGVEDQAQGGKGVHALAEGRLQIQAWLVSAHRTAYMRVSIPLCSLSDASEPAVTRCNVCLQRFLREFAQGQVGIANDGLSGATVGVFATESNGSLTDGKFSFSDRPQVLGTLSAVHGVTFDEYGGFNPVAAASDVLTEFLHKIAIAGLVMPIVNMGIDDREVWVQCFLFDSEG